MTKSVTSSDVIVAVVVINYDSAKKLTVEVRSYASLDAYENGGIPIDIDCFKQGKGSLSGSRLYDDLKAYLIRTLVEMELTSAFRDCCHLSGWITSLCESWWVMSSRGTKMCHFDFVVFRDNGGDAS